VLRLKQEVSLLTAETEKNQEQLRLQAAEHEEQRLSIEQQLQTLSTSQHKRGVEEDVEVIRVQRETREKSDRILVLESQYSAMERNLEGMRSNQTKLLQEIEQLNNRLKEEQRRSVELQTRLNSQSVVLGRVAELEQIVSDLQAEREILKNTNDRLMKRSLYYEHV
jgi:chromosome segregation ATPase